MTNSDDFSASFKNKMRMDALKDQEHEENEKLKQDLHMPEPDKNSFDYQSQKRDFDNLTVNSRSDFEPFQTHIDGTLTGRLNEPTGYGNVSPEDEAWAKQPDRVITPTQSTIGATFNTPNGDKNNVKDAYKNKVNGDPDNVMMYFTANTLSGDLNDLHNTKGYKVGNPAYKRIANKETTDNHAKQIVDVENQAKENVRTQLRNNELYKDYLMNDIKLYPEVYPEEYNKRVDKAIDEKQKARDYYLYGGADEDEDEDD